MALAHVFSVIFDNFRPLVVASACITVVFLLLRHHRAASRTRLPPGPMSFPVIGNLFFFVWHGFIGGIRKLAQTYGDICTARMGPATVVFLNKRELIREAFSLGAFSGRPNWQGVYGDVQLANAGVGDSTGEVWKTNRKLCLRHLSQLGLGKKQFEPDILDETDYLMGAIRDRNGGKFDIRGLLSNAVSNVICRLIFGKRFEYGEGEFIELLRCVQESVNIPILAFLLPHLRVKSLVK